MDLSKLSYTVQKKTDTILKLKDKMDKKRRSFKLPAKISCLLGIYVFIYNNRYTSYAAAIFENKKIDSAVIKFDFIILIILAAAIFIFYKLFIEFKKDKDKYEELRKDLIKTISNEFCTCKNTCTCKDDYIKYMEQKGIDLIFN
ncbi:MAG: hypothetical protein LIR50_09890 [Bacillota bacterium]|nr:hypothetical protein [Bacillota bacterium]